MSLFDSDSLVTATSYGAMGGFLFVLVAVFYMFFMGIAVLFYVFQSLGLMGMLKKCGYHKPWFAWVPFVNVLAIGNLAEKYDDGKPAKKIGKQLLVLQIIMTSMIILFYVFEIMLLISSAVSPIASGMLLVLLFIVFIIAVIVLAIVYSIKMYIAMWKIFRIFSPDYALVYILLCIFVNVTQPFIFFAIRNNEPKNLRQTEFEAYTSDTQYYNI